MKVNPKLNDALAVFKELGWDQATRSDVLQLPIGTAEQQRVAVAGLKSGDWGDFGQLSENTFGWISAVDVDEQMLGLFAIRIGVDPTRAVRIARGDDNVLLQCVLLRGEDFAQKYLQQYYRSPGRMHEHALSVQGGVGIGLACALGAEPLAAIEYLKDWAAVTLHALTGEKHDIYREQRWLPQIEELAPTFLDHVRVAVDNNLPTTGPFGKVIPAAVEKGILTRGEVLKLCITGLELSVRPGDRKAYVEILTSALRITDDELLDNREIIKALIAIGEAPIIEAFAPRLIASVAADEVYEVALPALFAKTAKSRLCVLKALELRTDLDSADAFIVADRLTEITELPHKQAANVARKLLERWNLQAEQMPEESAPIRGLWQKTPDLWELPRFEVGEASSATLAQAVNELRTRDQYIYDLQGDRLLAIAVELAKKSVYQARLALSGASQETWSGVLSQWANGQTITARASEYPSHVKMVFSHVGKIPCLLSTPSYLDSTVSYDDLRHRLMQYAEVKVGVLQTDLVLALLRLDTSQVDDTSELPPEIPVVLADGNHLDRDAAQVIRDYIADPLLEDAADVNKSWLTISVSNLPPSLDGLKFPLNLQYRPDSLTRLFPHWGTAAFTGLYWCGQEVSYAGLYADDASYRAHPLPPAAVMNLLALQRPVHPKMAPWCAQGIQQAWERGLLVPGVADVAYLDWSGELTHLASFAQAMRELADQGMLSLVWPVLDQIVVAALAAPRLPAGLAEVVHTMAECVPEVLAGVETGVASKEAICVPGLRTLASRKGSSQAVEAARAAVALLPEVSTESLERPAKHKRISDAEFSEVWPQGAGVVEHVEDGSRVCGFDMDNAVSTAALPVMFSFVGLPGETFVREHTSWNWSIVSEHQALVRRIASGERETEGYVRWDGSQAVFSEHRNWREDIGGPLEGEASSWAPFLAKIIIADVATAPDPIGERNTLSNLVKESVVGCETVRHAVNELLPFEQWSPARAVYLLESAPELLPALWPMLTEPLHFAAQQPKLPRWVNRVLDIVLLHAALLNEATARGYLPQDAWNGILDIAAMKGSSAAIKKARELRDLFDSLH